MTDAHALKNAIITKALELGFDLARVCRPVTSELEKANLREFIARGNHGSMSWMPETLERREDPRVLWGEVKSVLVLGHSYAPDHDPMQTLAQKDIGNISVYARHRDYHDVIKKRLKQLARWMVAELGGELKVFVDTAPVMEKALAARAGVGWQGKFTNIVSRQFGTWLFLGEIFTTLELPEDESAPDHCGSCQSCLDICPTAAFDGPYKIDARRCISYLTIEHAGPIDRDLRPLMGNRIYGCDDCSAICPWNKFPDPTNEPKYQARPDLEGPQLADLVGLDDAAFRALFSGSPIKRIKRERFIRNVLIAIGNSGNADHVAACETLLADASPTIRGAAVWALQRLLDGESFLKVRTHHQPRETDPGVLAEWESSP